LKIDRDYWNTYAFTDILIEGDFDKLEWIKNNEGFIHFGVIDKALRNPNKKIKEWFELNYFPNIQDFYESLNFD
jgi:hypothetical protein